MLLVAITFAFGALSSGVLSSGAEAQDAPLPLEVTVREMVNLPRESPEITVRATGDVQSARLVVREQNRAVLQKSLGRMRNGAHRVFRWRAEPGRHDYAIDLSGRGPEGPATATVEATVSVMRPLEIQISREDVDLTTRRVPFVINNPAGRARLTIFDQGGVVLHQAETDLGGRAAGTTLEVRWPELQRPIARMSLRVHDASDSWTEHELVPFFVDIPHEEVEFETARWEIRESERPKLDEAYELILEAIREHGSDLQARLYVLGHTDTVGSHGDNQLLSERRAAAIARYLLQRGGITIPIMSRGFGESNLRVQTADNVDEARNRRAQYILAAEPPSPGAWNHVR
jgi:outer membrane protein OmpA-like peptidoglycan-associated protein